VVQSRFLLDALLGVFLRSAETRRVLLRRLRVRARSTELGFRFGLRTLRGARALRGLHLADTECTNSLGDPYPVSLGLLEVLHARRATFEAPLLACTLCAERALGSFAFLARGAGRGRPCLALLRGRAVLIRPFLDALPADPEERGERVTTGHARQRSSNYQRRAPSSVGGRREPPKRAPAFGRSRVSRSSSTALRTCSAHTGPSCE